MRQYKKLLRLDPQDAKLQLEIADAHRRWGQIKEALETYERIAAQYSEEGFEARAVAVYKQILNLAPTHNDSYAKLAELYERMGLVGEALNSLRVAADALNKKGQRVEALGLLRRMAAIDPSNTTSRIKVANLLREEGLASEALAEFEALAVNLESQQDFEGAATACRSVLEIDADHAGSCFMLARILVAQKRFAEAVEPTRHGIELDPDAPEHYELLVEALSGARLEAELPDVYTRLADLHMRRGDEERAREIRQRYLDPSELDLGVEMEAEAASGADAAQADADLPSILAPAGSAELSDDLAEAAVDLPSLRDAKATSATVPIEAAGTALPELDLEQLVGEASALQGAGKHAQALECLEKVLDVDAEHLPALERLGELHAAMGASELALEAWQRAAKSAQEAGDAARFETLQARVRALEGAAAASGGDVSPVGSGGPEPFAGVVEIEIDVEGEAPIADPEGAAMGEPGVGEEVPSVATDAGPGLSEELEEADFYFRQGLYQEAEVIYRRILAADPEQANAVLRIAELVTLEEQSGSEAAEPIEAQELPGAEAPGMEAGGFDLAAELSDVLDDSFSEVAAQSGTDDGFATVFDAFKKGVGETLGDGDHQAHYDLGIAYKEMGLYSDAIDEFRVAMKESSRRPECMQLIGLCALDAGDATTAVENLEALLTEPGIKADFALSVRFDLGRALVALEAPDRARQAFEAVAAVDPEFRNVAAQLAELPPSSEPAASSRAEEDFENFEDLFAEDFDAVGADSAQAEDPPPDAESQRVGIATNSDSIGETTGGRIAVAVESPGLELAADAEPLDVETPSEAEPIAETANAEVPAAPARPRKKKISFA